RDGLPKQRQRLVGWATSAAQGHGRVEGDTGDEGVTDVLGAPARLVERGCRAFGVVVCQRLALGKPRIGDGGRVVRGQRRGDRCCGRRRGRSVAGVRQDERLVGPGDGERRRVAGAVGDGGGGAVRLQGPGEV